MQNEFIDITVFSSGNLNFRGHVYRCAIGRGGVREDKSEGDGATPVGRFPIREIYYRKDKLGELELPIPAHAISKNDAWCEDPLNQDYNKHIIISEDLMHDRFWRDDDLFDIIAVLGYNDDPVIQGKGSAIFMHLARPTYTPTAGCIALALPDLLAILSEVTANTHVKVMAHSSP